MKVEELFRANIEHIKDEVYKDFDSELSNGFFESGDVKDFGVEIELDEEHFAEVEYRANATYGHYPRTYYNPEEWYGYYHYEILRVKIYDNDSNLLYDNTDPQIEDTWEE